jgi:DHA1 family multidrug resistance protein-like MFS transporter
MVSDLFRESFVGQLIYRLSRRRVLQYAEEKPGFVLPERYRQHEKPSTRTASSHASSDPDHSRRSNAGTLVDQPIATNGDVEKGPKVPQNESEERSPEEEEKWRNPVDWYGPDDPENPMNVSFVAALPLGIELLLTLSAVVLL